MITKKLKGFKIFFMFMVMFSLVGCDSTPKYDDVIGYWKSEKEDIFWDKQAVIVFQKDYYTIMTGKEKVSFDEHDEYLSLFMDGPRGPEDYNVYITNADGDKIDIAIPLHYDLAENPTFYTYVRTTKEDAEKILGTKLK